MGPFKFSALSLILGLGLCLLCSCGPKSQPVPPSGDPSNQTNNDEAGAGLLSCDQSMNSDGLSGISETEISAKVLKGIPTKDIVVMESCLERFLPDGTYQGQMENGDLCEFKREETESGLQFSLKVFRAKDSAPIELNLSLDSKARSMLALKTYSSMRSSVQVLELEETFQGIDLYLNTISFHKSSSGKISVYIFKQSKMESELSSAECILK